MAAAAAAPALQSGMAEQGRPPLTEAALCAWVGQAGPGDWLAYHHGFLAVDTGSSKA